jgi:hypothetical protein
MRVLNPTFIELHINEGVQRRKKIIIIMIFPHVKLALAKSH